MGEHKRGRKLVAKNRIDASYEMGGLMMDLTTEIANGLVLCCVKMTHTGRMIRISARFGRTKAGL